LERRMNLRMPMKTASLYAAFILTGVSSLAAVDSGLLNLVMPDAKVLSGVQVDQTIVSPFAQYVLGQFQPNDAELTTFISTTGFAPRHDLREVLVATTGNSTVLLLGRGTFNIAQITAAATAHGGTVTQYNGVNIISQQGKGNGAVAFLDGGTAV